MHKKKTLFISASLFFVITFFSVGLKAQLPDIKWAFEVDGFNDVYLVDLAVDSTGNSYVAINYTSELTLPALKKSLPKAGHVHGLIMKINPKGKPLWAHPFKSAYDNRINDISLAPNGDLLITGFGDGLMHFPGLKDTLKVGITEKKQGFSGIIAPRGIYAARYAPNGERLWVQYWNTGWGEGISIAANKLDEVHLCYYHRGALTQNNILIDTFPERQSKIDSKFSLAKLSGDGKLQKIQTMAYEESSSVIFYHNIKFDHKDNLLMYGTFSGKIKLTEKDSLVNDSYYEGGDGYLAKFNTNGNLLWAKIIGGQDYQKIADIVIAPDNSIYASGHYRLECTLGDGVSVLQKSKYDWKSGESFFYFHVFNDGELDFVRYTDNEGYNSDFMGKSMAIDQSRKIHIVGLFNDTIRMDGFQISTWQYNLNGFYSCWEGNKLLKLGKLGDTPNEYMHTWHFDINKKFFAGAGEYYGDGANLKIQGKKHIFSNKDHGRACYIYGGTIPDENIPPEITISKNHRKDHIEKIKPLLACVKPDEEPAPNLWFPKSDSLLLNDSTKIQSPCGSEIKGMDAILFPNPATVEVKIKLSGIQGTAQIELFSETGQLLLSHRLEEIINEQIAAFDISGLRPAIYFIRITHKNYEKALRLVKNRY